MNKRRPRCRDGFAPGEQRERHTARRELRLCVDDPQRMRFAAAGTRRPGQCVLFLVAVAVPRAASAAGRSGTTSGGVGPLRRAAARSGVSLCRAATAASARPDANCHGGALSDLAAAVRGRIFRHGVRSVHLPFGDGHNGDAERRDAERRQRHQRADSARCREADCRLDPPAFHRDQIRELEHHGCQRCMILSAPHAHCQPSACHEAVGSESKIRYDWIIEAMLLRTHWQLHVSRTQSTVVPL